jgi:CelD/BcsL family acetyltransferase involved in cellulose biosynthesis
LTHAPSGQAADGLNTFSLHGLADLPPDVQALFHNNPLNDLQCSWVWFKNLAETALRPEQSAHVHVMRHKGQPTVALPVLAQRGPGGQRITALATYYTSLFAPTAVPALQAKAWLQLVQHLLQSHPPVVSIQLAPMDASTESFTALQGALRAAGLRTHDYFCFGNWYLPVASDSSSYLAQRPGDVRNTLRRQSKKFTAAGGQLLILSQAADAARAAALFTQVYDLSWKQPEPHPQFIPGLVRLCAEQGWLRMGLAVLDGQPIAAQLWMVAAGKASIFKLAYNPAHKQFSPGTLLTAHLMQQVIDSDHVTEVDYLTGDDAYKNQWMSQRRERRGLMAYNTANAAGWWLAQRHAWGQRLKPLRARWLQRQST